MTTRLAAFATSLLCFALAGCAATEEDPFPAEEVSAAEEDLALASVRDGDTVYIARPFRLDRMDARTGAIETVAGMEWARCPRDPDVQWLSMANDFTFPMLAAKGTTIALASEDCGVWTFDVATKTSRLLVDPSLEAKVAAQERTGTFPRGALWNGQDGPDWQQYFGISLAFDGDGLLACFGATSATDADGGSRRDAIELWSVALDGTPRERLVQRFGSDRPFAGPNYCNRIVADEASVLLSTEVGVLRFDRATRAVTDVARVGEYGSSGFEVDASDVFLEVKNAIVKVPRAGGPPVTLRASSGLGSEPTRLVSGVDERHVYFQEGRSMLRVAKGGGDAEVVAAGTELDWILPGFLPLAAEHVYFQRVTERPSAGTLAPERAGQPTYHGALFRVRR